LSTSTRSTPKSSWPIQNLGSTRRPSRKVESPAKKPRIVKRSKPLRLFWSKTPGTHRSASGKVRSCWLSSCWRVITLTLDGTSMSGVSVLVPVAAS
jgi:hypothetical protein